MTPPNPRDEELSKETHEFIRFLLRDHAFSEEFLVTAVQEYFQHNGMSQTKQPCESEAPADHENGRTLQFCTFALGHSGKCSWETTHDECVDDWLANTDLRRKE